MNRIAAAATALAATVIVTGAGTAHAGEVEVVNYAATSTGQSTIIKTDGGSLSADNGVFAIRAANGAVLGGTELTFRVDDFVFPIAADISGRVATLTPQFDLAHAVYQPVALPYENQAPWKTEYDREVAAWSRLTSTISMGATIGTAVGCITGVSAVGFLGTLAGQILITAPVAILAAAQYFTTVNSPFPGK